MLSAGTRGGPYEIVSWLGAGGMGEVYRARDTKLLREVALKTLPEEPARQPERLARLKQEARILASLNHPGIATHHGLEDSDGVPVLVMELVEGETLGDRLRRGPLPLREAVTVAHQIALALEAAHEKGILHRDLKPANIRLAPRGRVKLLDFGLARAVRAIALDPRLDTETSPHSQPGTVLGTAPYMSPEQARGQEVDRRGDVWAFGCVLFEMLAGKRAFQAMTFSETVVAVLDREPDWPALPQETPSAAVRLLRRCLRKDKGERLHDIADARLELEEVLAGPPSTGEVLRGPRLSASWPAIAALATLLAGIGWWPVQRPPSARKEVVRLSLRTAVPLSDWTPLLSPDGQRYVDATPSGLMVRDLDKSEGRLIPGTASAHRPFFSSDGHWLGFNDVVDGTLKKVSLTGGAPLTLCKGPSLIGGATWGPDDTIVFTPDFHSGLWQVPAAGGDPRELTKADRSRGEKSHRWPHYLPGGKAVLFTVGTSRLTKWDEARIEILLLPSGERRTILEGGTGAAYAESGHLVYQRGASIHVAPFDLDRLATTGAPVAVVDGGRSASLNGIPRFTVTRTGMLAYLPDAPGPERLVRVDRAGEARPLGPRFDFPLEAPRLSPDGRVVAVEMGTANSQVWRFDIEREVFSQVTFEWDNRFPAWTADGESLIVSSTPGWTLHRVRADGSGSPEPMVGGQGSGRHLFGSATADGKLYVYEMVDPSTRGDIWILPLAPAREPRAFLRTPADEGLPAISPSGRFLAYNSDESGQQEIYVRSFPDAAARSRCPPGEAWTPSGRAAGRSSSTGLRSRVRNDG